MNSSRHHLSPGWGVAPDPIPAGGGADEPDASSSGWCIPSGQGQGNPRGGGDPIPMGLGHGSLEITCTMQGVVLSQDRDDHLAMGVPPSGWKKATSRMLTDRCFAVSRPFI